MSSFETCKSEHFRNPWASPERMQFSVGYPIPSVISFGELYLWRWRVKFRKVRDPTYFCGYSGILWAARSSADRTVEVRLNEALQKAILIVLVDDMGTRMSEMNMETTPTFATRCFPKEVSSRQESLETMMKIWSTSLSRLLATLNDDNYFGGENGKYPGIESGSRMIVDVGDRVEFDVYGQVLDTVWIKAALWRVVESSHE